MLFAVFFDNYEGSDLRIYEMHSHVFKIGLNKNKHGRNLDCYPLSKFRYHVDGNKLAFISIPDGIKCENESKFSYQYSQLFVDKIIDFKDWEMWNDEKFCLEMIEHDDFAFEQIKNPSETVCLAALKKRADHLELIKNQPHKMCMVAMETNGEALEFVKEQTEDICLKALERCPWMINEVKNQTEELCLKALEYGPMFILDGMTNQTEKVCLEAVKLDKKCLEYIRDERMKEFVMNTLKC